MLQEKTLSQAYQRKDWIQFLQTIFPKNTLREDADSIAAIDTTVASAAYQLGSITITGESIERKISVFEVELADGIVIERNRIGLRNLLRKQWKDIDAAFVVFYRPDSSQWRFSYISELTGYDAEGNRQEVKTEPKRYTYILGEGEAIKTAITRFTKLATKRQKNTLEDIKEAFSVEKISKEFFDEYRKHYHRFIDYMNISNFKKSIFKDDEKAIRDFCKKLLGRIMFLYFVQKKGWLGATNTEYKDGNPNFIKHLFEVAQAGDAFYPLWLSKLFFEALNNEKRNDDDFEMPTGEKVKIPFLNGGLFEREEYDDVMLTIPALLFCAVHLQEAEDTKRRGFLDFLNAYNFTIDEDSPDNHTVAVDPEMLGHIFENLLEDNKEKGAFYTPKEIVHYMCQESLIEYLATQCPSIARQSICTLLKQRQNTLSIHDLEMIEEALDSVKICDPAIGSGAFPMGLLHEIFNLKELIAYQTRKEWNPAEVKANIIQKSIYGVDIEKGAVDIARLRFWLSLIVDEPKPKALPNLDYKIVVGNSLVSKLGDEVIQIDWDNKNSVGKADQYIKKLNKSLSILSQKQLDYFTTKHKEDLKKEIRNLKIEILISQLSFNRELFLNKNSQIMDMGMGLKPAQIKKNLEIELQLASFDGHIKKLNTLKNNPQEPLLFFDWKLDFPEVLNPYFEGAKGGFDIVIGNPPYIKEYNSKSAFDGIRDTEHYQGKMDIWYAFVTKCIEYTKTKTGLLCYIATNNWVTNSGASNMRNKMLQNTTFLQFVDFGASMVFDSADVQTMIMLFQNDNTQDNYSFSYSRLVGKQNGLQELQGFLEKKPTPQAEYLTPIINKAKYKDQFLTFGTDKLTLLLNQIEEQSNFSLTDKEIANGIHPHYDYVSKKTQLILGKSYRVGQGIFVLSQEEKEALQPNAKELELLKPYYTTEQLGYYYGNPKNKEWIIYTDSRFKNPDNIKPYPNIKKHLDQFQSVITSDNKPYGLHRAREESFFQGEKIVALRMCPNYPVFTYTDFDCYVSATFYVIKTKRINQKYLTVLLNSSLIRFWLKNKGKMKGNNFQLDKKPLLNLPIKTVEDTTPFERILEYVLFLREQKLQNPHDKQGVMISYFQSVLDTIVFEVYFEEEAKKVGRQVLPHLQNLKPLATCLHTAEKYALVQETFEKLHHGKHPVRIAEYYLDVIPAYEKIKKNLQNQNK